MSLRDWQKNGWLIPHQTSAAEIADLFAVADRDIAASQTAKLVDDWRFAIAYNASLQLATAALAAAGYRAERNNHHFRVIQSLELTIGVGSQTVMKLDMFRKKRNLTDYERVGLVSAVEVREAIALAQDLRKQVKDWMGDNYPALMLS